MSRSLVSLDGVRSVSLGSAFCGGPDWGNRKLPDTTSVILGEDTCPHFFGHSYAISNISWGRGNVSAVRVSQTLTCYHVWLSSTCPLQGVRGTVLVGPQFQLVVFLALRVSKGFWGLRALRVYQDQEETEGHQEKQARKESRCVPRDNA